MNKRFLLFSSAQLALVLFIPLFPWLIGCALALAADAAEFTVAFWIGAGVCSLCALYLFCIYPRCRRKP